MSTELVDPMASVRAYLAAEKSSSTRRFFNRSRIGACAGLTGST